MNAKRIAWSALLCTGLLLAAVWGAGEALSRPAVQAMGAPPSSLQVSPVRMVSPGGMVSGWMGQGKPGHGAVLLLHGVRGHRMDMVERARMLQAAGYAVLLIDLPAHGESTGERITFGAREAEGVRVAMAYLRQHVPGERVGVIGKSLGAASVVLAHTSPPPDAVVLESMYPTIDEAVANRLTRRLSSAGGLLAPLLLWQLPLRADVSSDDLRPIRHMASLNAPVFVMSGANDDHTTIAESQRIFEAAREPKFFWAVEGAAHIDLHNHRPQAYADRVMPFLEMFLRTGS
ncbi:MAG: hypothetical protein RLZZ618_833 [Pseudomonadota bacterium]